MLFEVSGDLLIRKVVNMVETEQFSGMEALAYFTVLLVSQVFSPRGATIAAFKSKVKLMCGNEFFNTV